MATPQSLWNGITAAFYGVVLSILMMFVFGVSVENIITQFDAIGLFDTAYPWNMAYEDSSLWVSTIYMVCVAPSIIGIIILFMSAIKTQEYDVFEDANQSPYGGQGIPQNVTADEIAFQQQMQGR